MIITLCLLCFQDLQKNHTFIDDFFAAGKGLHTSYAPNFTSYIPTTSESQRTCFDDKPLFILSQHKPFRAVLKRTWTFGEM